MDGVRKQVVLVVLVHGNNAGPSDWAPFDGAFREACAAIDGARLVLICSNTNAYNTHTGIDELGRKLADEILAELDALPSEDGTVVKPILSIVGHSLGGLVARWALGHLYRQGVLQSRVVPGVYMSLCTPHLGVRAPGWRLQRAWINLAGVRGRTAQQLVLGDADAGRPLLDVLAAPGGEYMSALQLFKIRVAGGMAAKDTLVPCASACIFLGMEDVGPQDGVSWSSRVLGQADLGQNPEVPEASIQHWGWPRNAANGWIEDVSGSLNMPSSVLNGLWTLEWRRLWIAAPSSWIAFKTAHDFPINKGQLQSIRDTSQQCVDMLVKMLADDIAQML